jgi:hypothetical protein
MHPALISSNSAPRAIAPGSPQFDDSVYSPAALYNTVRLPLSLPTFNVLNYGAVGSGLVDDTVAIRAAQAAAQAVGGGYIYHPGVANGSVAGIYAVCPQIGDSGYLAATASYSVTVNTSTAVLTGAGMPAGGAVNVSFQNGQNLRFTAGSGAVMSANGTFAIGTTYYMGMITPTTFFLYDTSAHAIAGGSTGKITFSSAGSGLVFGGEPCGFVFTVSSDNIIFIGDGGGPVRGVGDGTGSPGPTDSRGALSTLKFYCYGLRNPATDFVTGVVSGTNVANRGGMFLLDGDGVAGGTPGNLLNIHLRSLCCDGQIPYNGDHTYLNNQVTGSGWDTSNQAIAITNASHTVNFFELNCLLKGWTGEEIHGDGELGTYYMIQNQHRTCNVDAVSVSANWVARYNVFGGANANDNIGNNASENFYTVASGLVTHDIQYNTFDQCNFGTVVLAPVNANTIISHNSYNRSGTHSIMFYDFCHAATVSYNTFTNGPGSGDIAYTQQDGVTYAPWSAYYGFSNIALSHNTFGAGTQLAIACTSDGIGIGAGSDNVAFSSTNDTISAGTFISGGFGGSVKGAWQPFTITNLTMNNDFTQDLKLDSGNPENVAIWSGTTRNVSVPGYGAGSTLYSSCGINQTGSGASFTGKIFADLTFLLSNDQVGNQNTATPKCAFDFDPAYLASIPDGFQTTFFSYYINFTIKANGSWNTLVSDDPIPQYGSVTYKKISGLFVKQ